MASCHGTGILEFTKVLRVTNSFTNVCRSGLHAWVIDLAMVRVSGDFFQILDFFEIYKNACR